MNRRCLLAALGLGLTTLFSCGYHVGGTADTIPKKVETIYIPAFSNATKRYQLTDLLPTYISREFIARTRFQVVKDPSVADAVLNGTINQVVMYPIISDPTSGKATTISTMMFVTVTLTDRATGKQLYSGHLGLKSAYNIPTVDLSDNPAQPGTQVPVGDVVAAHQYFDESMPAYDRMCRDGARQIVSAVLENF